MAHTSLQPAFLSSVPLFGRLNASEREELSTLLKPVSLRTGEMLFHQGAPATTLWVLGPGVEVLVSQSDGPGARSFPISTLHAGETVGEMALIDEGLRSASATVLHGGVAYVLDAVELHLWRDAGRPAAFKVTRQLALELCARLRGTSDLIVAHGTPHDPVASETPGERPTPEELNDFPALRSLPAVVKVALAEKLRRIDVAQVTPLFAEGDLGDAAYFLVEGEVSVGRAGKTLAHLHAGELFGMVSVLDGGLRSASCVTSGPARLWRLSAADFELLFAAGNRFALQIVDAVTLQLVAHLRGANDLLATIQAPTRGVSDRPLRPHAEAESYPRSLSV